MLTVRLRVVWVPVGEAGRLGRVVAQRSTGGSHEGRDGGGDGPAGPPAFWLSEPLTAGSVLGIARAGAPEAWHDLLAGRPVGEVPGPVALRPAERSALDALERELAGSDAVPGGQRPLLLATCELRDGAPVSARVVRFAGDVLAHAFDAVFEAPPQGLVLAKTTVGGTAAAGYDVGTRLAVDAWIPVADVAAARPGACRGRVNRLLLAPTAPDAALAAPLTDPALRHLVAALAADPGDEGLRDRLAEALGGAPGPRRAVEADTTTIDVGGAGCGPVLDLLDGLVALATCPAGGAGPGLVTLLAPTGAAAALLRRDERLAAALADYLEPRRGEELPASLRRRRELRAALQAAAAQAATAGGPAR